MKWMMFFVRSLCCCLCCWCCCCRCCCSKRKTHTKQASPLAEQISAKQRYVDQCSRSSAAAATKLDELHSAQAKLEKRVAEAQAASEAAEAKRIAAVSELA